MATKIYLPHSTAGAAAVSPTFGAGWHRNSDADRVRCFPFKSGTAMTSKNVITSTGETVSFCLARQYVSDPMKAMTLSGTITGQIRCLESNAGLNATIAIRIAICNEDGSNVREVLAIAASDNTAATPPEMATSLTNRQLQDAAEATTINLTSTTVNEKDRLIIEVGMRESNTTANRNADLSLGDDSATDLPADNTTTAANNPFVTFSATIVFRDLAWRGTYDDQTYETPQRVDYGPRPGRVQI